VRLYKCRICGFTGSATDVAKHCFYRHGRPEWAVGLYLCLGRRPGAWRLFRELVEEEVVEAA